MVAKKLRRNAEISCKQTQNQVQNSSHSVIQSDPTIITLSNNQALNCTIHGSTDQPINDSTKRPINSSINQSINPDINQLSDQLSYHLINQPNNQSPVNSAKYQLSICPQFPQRQNANFRKVFFFLIDNPVINQKIYIHQKKVTALEADLKNSTTWVCHKAINQSTASQHCQIPAVRLPPISKMTQGQLSKFDR